MTADVEATVMPDDEGRSLRLSLLRGSEARILHFVRRAKELGRGESDTLIVVLDVDDELGGAMADELMPGHDWQRYRDRGEKPVARGLTELDGVAAVLVAAFGADVGERLRGAMSGEYSVAVVAAGGVLTAYAAEAAEGGVLDVREVPS